MSLRRVFLGDGGMTVTLARSWHAGSCNRPAGSSAWHGTRGGRNLAPENLCANFPVVLVYPVDLARTLADTLRAVPEALVVLHIGGNIVTLMYFFRFAGEGADMFVSQTRGDAAPPSHFLVELIVQIIVAILSVRVGD